MRQPGREKPRHANTERSIEEENKQHSYATHTQCNLKQQPETLELTGHCWQKKSTIKVTSHKKFATYSGEPMKVVKHKLIKSSEELKKMPKHVAVANSNIVIWGTKSAHKLRRHHLMRLIK